MIEPMNRRHFMRHLLGTGMTIPMLQWIDGFHQVRAASTESRGRSFVLIWLGGGPSTIDMWDLKPGTKNGGEFQPIDTAVPGIQISEHLPKVAQQMKNLSIIRSYTSRDGSHERGTYINHTAYAPVASVIHPAIGAVIAHLNTPSNLEIPGHISLGGPGVSPGFLGAAYAPFRVQAGDDPVPNVKSSVELRRFGRRQELLATMQDGFIRQSRGPLAKEHNTILGRARDLMSSKLLESFKVANAPTALRDRFGDHQFGRNCLLATRLVEIGVPFVEIGLGGWDTHRDVFGALGTDTNALLPQLDQGFGGLMATLAESGLLETTTVCCMGDFGRTPKINQDTGRDHWPTGWSVVLGGGGIKGGQVIGKTSDDGMEIADRPVDVSNLFATMYKAVGIAPYYELESTNGRPLKIVGALGDGKPVAELVG